MKNIHKLSAAIALALVAGSANAALTLTYDPSDSSQQTPINNGAGSSILLAVNDQLNGSANFGKTFLLDLSLDHSGLTYSSFVNGTQGTSSTLSWNLSNYADFNSIAGDLAHLSWSVVGASVLDQNTLTNLNDVAGGYPLTAVAPWGVVATEQSTAVWSGNLAGWAGLNEQASVNTDSVGGAISATNVSLTKLNAVSNEVLAPAAGTGAFAYSALFPYEGTIGANSVPFYFVTNQNGLLGDGADTNIVSKLGTFSLNANDVLTYNPVGASSVPVPAGVWLFLSGLCGALGLSRKSSRTKA